jgi:hypothetical protein
MTQSIQPAGLIVVDGLVTSDIPCRRCAYNLRGLAATGICPECGSPVEISIGGDLLRYSDAQYIETLRGGIHLIFLGLVATIVAAVLSAVFRHGVDQVFSTSLLRLAAQVPEIIGVWFLTAPDPAGIGESRHGTVRRVIRVCIAIGVVNYGVDCVLAVTHLPRTAVSGLQAVALIAGIADFVGELAMLSYLSRLATRIPDPKLEQTANTLLWGIGISKGIVLAMVAIALPFVGGGAMNAAFAGLGCIMGIASLAVLVLSIMYLVMLGNFASRFREEAEKSRLLWAIATEKAKPPLR